MYGTTLSVEHRLIDKANGCAMLLSGFVAKIILLLVSTKKWSGGSYDNHRVVSVSV